MSREDVLKQMQDSTKKIEKKVAACDYYKKHKAVLENVKKLTYCGELILPYILSFFLGEMSLEKIGHSVFSLDKVKYYENVQETICSNGEENIKSSTEETFDESFYTSTAWIQDEFGNYTREEVYYNLEVLKEYDLNELLAMSNDELKSLFPIINRKMYIKNSLSEDDLKYDDNMIIISKCYREYNESLDTTQTVSDNIFDIFICFVVTLIWGLGISKIVVRHNVSSKIGAFIEEIKTINLDEYRKLLRIRQDNLSLLEVTKNKKLMKEVNL